MTTCSARTGRGTAEIGGSGVDMVFVRAAPPAPGVLLRRLAAILSDRARGRANRRCRRERRMRPHRGAALILTQ